MKSAFRFLAFALLVTTMFSVASCRSDTSAVAEVMCTEIDNSSDMPQEATQDTIILPANEIIRFTPLADSERFTYSIQGRKLALYAVRNNDLEDISELFTWENVGFHGVQFTSDFRKCFFTVRVLPPHRSGTPLLNYHFKRYLYTANGETGEIRRLPFYIAGVFRVSKDGRFVGFTHPWRQPDFGNNSMWYTHDHINIFLFDIKTETMTHFEWQIDGIIEGSWHFLRFDNVFRIYGVGEGGFIGAVAELDPATMELSTLWDITGMSADEGKLVPFDESWEDDVYVQIRNPTVRLQR